MDLESCAIEIDGRLVGELKKSSGDTFIFIPENFEERPNFRNLNSDNEILLEGRSVSYDEFMKLIKDSYVPSREEYHKLWNEGSAYLPFY